MTLSASQLTFLFMIFFFEYCIKASCSEFHCYLRVLSVVVLMQCIWRFFYFIGVTVLLFAWNEIYPDTNIDN